MGYQLPIYSVSLTSPPSVTIEPTGNTYDTLATLNVQASSNEGSERTYLAHIGFTSSDGVGDLYGSTPSSLYVGMVGEKGTGDIWAVNPLVTSSPGVGNQTHQGTELDINNFNQPMGYQSRASGMVAPAGLGLTITGAAWYSNTVALAVEGANPNTWQRGVVVNGDVVVQTEFAGYSNAQVGLDLGADKLYGIDLNSMSIGSIQPVLDTNGGGYTSQPTVSVSSGTASYVAYLGLLNGSTIASAGTGYKIGDQIWLNGGSLAPGYGPAILIVTGVNGSGGVTGYTIASVVPIGGTTLAATAVLGATVLDVTDVTSLQIGTVVYVELDTTVSGGGHHTQQIAVQSISGNNVTVYPPLSAQASSGNAFTDIGNAASMGGYTAIPSNPVGQMITTGAGTGFALTATWGVSQIGRVSNGTGYTASTLPTISFSGGGASVQATATAILGGNAMRLANGMPIVARNAANNSDLSILYLDSSNVLQIGQETAITSPNSAIVTAQGPTNRYRWFDNGGYVIDDVIAVLGGAEVSRFIKGGLVGIQAADGVTGVQVNSGGEALLGQGAASQSPLSLSATSGFAYIGATDGTPTGVPGLAATGSAPIVYNYANHRLEVYDHVAGDWYYFTGTAN